MSLPYMKFYPRDWRGDQALRSVSIAARGLWMECLCIMHEAKPYGHLLLNGNPVDDDTLARMAGVPVDEVARLMAELRQAGVLSVTRKGIVISRRMTKDHARAQKGKAAVEKRWNQPITDEPQASDTKQKSDAPNRLPNREPITQKPEARNQKDAKASLLVKNQFDEFWQVYPRKVAKDKARPAFEKALKRADFDEIMAGVRRYASTRSGADPQFTAHASTWLTAGRWADELPQAPAIPQQKQPPSANDRDSFLSRVAGRIA
jgi:hypothetical protein